jgi:hypothetical protein
LHGIADIQASLLIANPFAYCLLPIAHWLLYLFITFKEMIALLEYAGA